MQFNSHVPNLKDAEFISFLYSERERENNLNQYQGWNNWVLVVALISTVCVLYTTCRNNTDISIGTTFYFISGLVAAGFSYKTIIDIFRRERAYDFNRVRYLKDVVPWVDIVSILFASAILSTWSYLHFEGVNHIFLVWSNVFICYILLLIYDLLSREDLTPVNLNSALFPKLYQNVIFNGFFGAFWGGLFQHSFRMAGKDILSEEFEIAVYTATIFFLIYFILRINGGNKVVKEFDSILDRYLYQGASKENTYNLILMNRMGYGVLEVCYKEWYRILTMLKQSEEDERKIVEIKEAIVNNKYDLNRLPLYWNLLQENIVKMKKLLKETQRLSARLDEFVKVSDGFEKEDVERLFATNEMAYSNIDKVCQKISELKNLIQAEIDKYYCNKIGVLCKKDCDHRTDNRSWRDVVKYRWHNFNKGNVRPSDP